MNNTVSSSRWPLILACASLLSACGGTAPPASSGKPAGGDVAAASPYKPTATFQEIMDSVVDFSSDYIWKAVSTTVDKKGVHEMQPRTDEEWHEFRRRAVLLVEAANLIAVPGRKVAHGDKAVEDGQPLEVAKIQERLDAHHDQLVGFADALREVSVKLVEAADKKDVAVITDLGGTLDEVCESCHKVFWYPDQPAPTAAPAAAPAK
jgi:hypothetical protein